MIKSKPLKHAYSTIGAKNVKKNLLCLSALTLCSASLFAGTMGEVSPSMNHLYIGGSGGGTFSTTTAIASSLTNINFPVPGFNTNNTANIEVNLKQNAGIGALFLGYGLDYQKIYLGAEVFANISQYKMHASTGTDTTQSFVNNTQAYHIQNNWQIKSKVSPFQYGLDIRPGFLVQPWLMIFGRVGFAAAKLTQSAILSGPIVYEAGNPPIHVVDTYPFASDLTTSHNKIALRLGAGFEYYLNSKWSTRMDYINVNYGRVQSNSNLNSPVIGNPAFEGNGTLVVTGNVNMKRVTTNTIMIGISRYFV